MNWAVMPLPKYKGLMLTAVAGELLDKERLPILRAGSVKYPSEEEGHSLLPVSAYLPLVSQWPRVWKWLRVMFLTAPCRLPLGMHRQMPPC